MLLYGALHDGNLEQLQGRRWAGGGHVYSELICCTLSVCCLAVA